MSKFFLNIFYMISKFHYSACFPPSGWRDGSQCNTPVQKEICDHTTLQAYMNTIQMPLTLLQYILYLSCQRMGPSTKDTIICPS